MWSWSRTKAISDVETVVDNPGDKSEEEASEEPEEKPRDAGWLTRSEAQARIVVYLTQAHEVDAARELALAILDRWDRNRALRNIVRVLAADADYERAIEILIDFDHPFIQVEAASDVAKWMIENDNNDLAREVLSRAAEIASRVGDPGSRGQPGR